MSGEQFGGLFFGGWGDYQLWAEHGFQPRASVEHDDANASVADDGPPADHAREPPQAPASARPADHTVEIPVDLGPPPEPQDSARPGAGPALPLVRPYLRTRGRTRPTQRLGVETLISAHSQGRADPARLTGDHRAIWLTCRTPQSTAEVAARLSLPIGAARVLISDLVDLGIVHVHENRLTADHRPPIELMIRVREALHNLV